ncbi:hypothetical protein ACVPOS_03080 [Staphylococcus aureus]
MSVVLTYMVWNFSP